ncbi:MAG: glycosyltransferase [Bacteroidetes bacterium]|nr:glycosyltransferase [Bacteroidota bacterium]
MKILEDYREIVGDDVIADIYRYARTLYGKRILHINSTYYGGGVAEILDSLVPLLNNIGLDTDWRLLRGTPEFFTITKKFHNAIQGEEIHMTDIKASLYVENNQDFSIYCNIDADVVFIHDPQPLPLIRFYRKRQPWLWRCHVDLSHPNEELWNFLKGFILTYDGIIVSDERYVRKELPMTYTIIDPAIDPLTTKNRDLPDELYERTLQKYSIPTDKPLITQISRFDKWKDPIGVIEVFKRIRKQFPCRLVLCGSMATDDPEGWDIFEQTREAAGSLLDDKEVILITVEDNVLVNTLQRKSAVIIQKSIREGFGLTVTEALWKGTPVVASNVGGIPRQVIDNTTGFLVEPYDYNACAELVLSILRHPKVGAVLGANGKEHVRRNFLITRHIIDDLRLLNKLLVK